MQAAQAETLLGPSSQLAWLHPADPDSKMTSVAAEFHNGTYTR
jgi:hypothetical protein